MQALVVWAWRGVVAACYLAQTGHVQTGRQPDPGLLLHLLPICCSRSRPATCALHALLLARSPTSDAVRHPYRLPYRPTAPGMYFLGLSR